MAFSGQESLRWTPVENKQCTRRRRRRKRRSCVSLILTPYWFNRQIGSMGLTKAALSSAAAFLSSGGWSPTAKQPFLQNSPGSSGVLVYGMVSTGLPVLAPGLWCRCLRTCNPQQSSAAGARPWQWLPWRVCHLLGAERFSSLVPHTWALEEVEVVCLPDCSQTPRSREHWSPCNLSTSLNTCTRCGWGRNSAAMLGERFIFCFKRCFVFQ